MEYKKENGTLILGSVEEMRMFEAYQKDIQTAIDTYAKDKELAAAQAAAVKKLAKDVTEMIKICYEQAFSLINESSEYASRLYCMRGRFLESIGDKKEALKDYKKALLLNPDECQAMLGVGSLLMFDGKYTSAELMFEKILIRFSSDIGAEERYCIKRASEKLIALYGDLDFNSEEYKRIAEFAAFL